MQYEYEDGSQLDEPLSRRALIALFADPHIVTEFIEDTEQVTDFIDDALFEISHDPIARIEIMRAIVRSRIADMPASARILAERLNDHAEA